MPCDNRTELLTIDLFTHGPTILVFTLNLNWRRSDTGFAVDSINPPSNLSSGMHTLTNITGISHCSTVVLILIVVLSIRSVAYYICTYVAHVFVHYLICPQSPSGTVCPRASCIHIRQCTHVLQILLVHYTLCIIFTI